MTTYIVNTPDDIVDGNYGQLSLREPVNLSNATGTADTPARSTTRRFRRTQGRDFGFLAFIYVKSMSTLAWLLLVSASEVAS